MKAKVFVYAVVILSVFLLVIVFGGNISGATGAERSDAKKAVEFKTVYPGVYDKDEQELLNITKDYLSGDAKVLMEKLAKQLAGDTKQIGDMKLNHALQPMKNYTPDAGTLVAGARKVYPLNPLYTNPEYAKKTGYNGLTAASITVQPGFGFAYIPKGTDIWVSSDDPAPGRGLDHELTFYKPIYEGDTLNGMVTEQSITDITDPRGSKVRKFRCVGRGEVYNQKGELVISAFYSGIETFKIFKERSMAKDYDRPLTIAVNKPDGYWDKLRDWHVYTDADWKHIKELWSKEEIRGSRTLYWEDVKVGDEPTWTVDGPSYLYKVPYLKEEGKFMLTHGFDGDLAITKAYVCDKYVKDGRHYADLVVWLETIDGEVWSECYAVVELPSKEDKIS